jgi:hypothetical protein
MKGEFCPSATWGKGIKKMARVANDGFGAGGGSPERHIDASGQSHIQLPDAEFIRDSELTRDGQDLIFTAITARRLSSTAISALPRCRC